jgi:hypothetical protein
MRFSFTFATLAAVSTLAACGEPDAALETAASEAAAPEALEVDHDDHDHGHEDEHLELAELFHDGPTRFARIDLFGSGPQLLPVTVRDGGVYFQGDMLLGREGDVTLVDAAPEAATKGAFGAPGGALKSAVSHRNPWPNGEIVFQIDSAAFPAGSAMRTRIDQAIANVNANTMIKLRAKGAADLAFLRITSHPDGVTCSSFLGFAPPPVPMLMQLGPDCSVGNIMHEFGHSAGLMHEQSRADRDDHIRVRLENIQDDKEAQFRTYAFDGIAGLDVGSFDFGSLMMYGSFTGFENNPAQPAMNKRSCAANDFSAACVWTGQRNAFSSTDAAGLARQVTGDPMLKFKIRNVGVNQCLRPTGGSTAEGVAIDVVACNSEHKSQRWYTWRRPGMARDVVVNEHSRHCLARNAAGTLVQSRCTGVESAKQFVFTGLGLFRGEQLQQSGGRCVVATATGATVSTSCADTQSREFTRDYL